MEHPYLKNFFTPAGLEVHISTNEENAEHYGWLYSTKYGTPLRIHNSVYNQFMVVGISTGDIVQKLFYLAKAHRLWFGTINQHHHPMEWDDDKRAFVEIEVSKEEYAFYNDSPPPAAPA